MKETTISMPIAEKQDFFNISKASDLKNPKDRFIYRLFEILPGLLSLGILAFAVLISWLIPFWAAIFIIIFVIFWFFRTIYYSFYLWIGYKKMEDHEKADWLNKLDGVEINKKVFKKLKTWKDIYHLIVIPMYEESTVILRDTLRSIDNSDYPRDRMIVVLACEEKARKTAAVTSKEIEDEFKSKFFKFLVTWHPSDIVGEMAGKGSNESWAAKKAKQTLIDPSNIPYENIVFSSFDADTCIFSKYFSCLTYHYLTSEKPTRTSFQPIPLYTNNIWQAPLLSKIFSFSSTFWHTMSQERPDKLITFSSHSMSFVALNEVGFKQTNIVPDDSRIFWQCFLKFNGDYEVKPLYYPISMDANLADGFFKTMINIYKQQRRWAYGVSDIPYFLFGFLKNKKIPLAKKFDLALELIEGHLSWATASVLIFVLGWLPLILGGEAFTHTMISYNLPIIISRVMTASMFGLLTSIYFSLVLLPPRPLAYGKHKYIVFILGWILFPMTMIFFTSFPALDAQIHLLLGKYMGFWVTEKVRK